MTELIGFLFKIVFGLFGIVIDSDKEGERKKNLAAEMAADMAEPTRLVRVGRLPRDERAADPEPYAPYIRPTSTE